MEAWSWRRTTQMWKSQRLGFSSTVWWVHWQVFEEEMDSIILLCHFSESYKKMLPLLFPRCEMTQQNLKLCYLQHCSRMWHRKNMSAWGRQEMQNINWAQKGWKYFSMPLSKSKQGSVYKVPIMGCQQVKVLYLKGGWKEDRTRFFSVVPDYRIN